MKKLPTQFTEKGFNYQQIFREGNVAVYEQLLKVKGAKAGSITPAFETIVIKEAKDWEIRGIKVLAHEVYPSANHWGDLGWTFTDKPTALAKARELLESQSAAN